MASQSLQDPYLNILRKEHIPVSIFLMNGIKLQGQIESFDQFVVLLKNNTSQMIYKHAISTIVPSQPVKMHREPRTHSETEKHNVSEQSVDAYTKQSVEAGPIATEQYASHGK